MPTPVVIRVLVAPHLVARFLSQHVHPVGNVPDWGLQVVCGRVREVQQALVALLEVCRVMGELAPTSLGELVGLPHASTGPCRELDAARRRWTFAVDYGALLGIALV